MRKLLVVCEIALDGVIHRPQDWSPRFWSDALTTHARDLLFTADALLLGRETYEVFAEAWPTRTDDLGIAQRFNELPKYVASTTLQQATWNATLIRDNVPETVEELKRQPGKDLIMYGCGGLARTLTRHGLVDEVRLTLFPVAVGAGARLFHGGTEQIPLQLIETRQFPNGVVGLTYQPAPRQNSG